MRRIGLEKRVEKVEVGTGSAGGRCATCGGAIRETFVETVALRLEGAGGGPCWYRGGGERRCHVVLRLIVLLALSAPALAQDAVWNAYMDQAHAAWAAGDVKKSERLYRLAAKEAEGTDPNGLPLASSLYSLGVLLLEMGEHEGAEALHVRALEIRKAKLGPDHPRTADVLNLLGLCRLRNNDTDGAIEAFRDVSRIRALNEDRRGEASARANLGLAYSHRGEFAKADRLIQGALRVYDEIVDRRSLDYAEMLSVVADHCESAGEYERAARATDAVVDIYDALGNSHRLLEALEFRLWIAQRMSDRATEAVVQARIDRARAGKR